jgi:hypothetical protein
MNAGTPALVTVANHWLARFEAALSSRDAARLRGLFSADSHWRDVLALTWRIQTVNGAQPLAAQLSGCAVKADAFGVDPNRTPPRHVTRAGTRCIEALFRFETSQGLCNGVLRLLSDERTEPKAWTLLTALEEIKGHEERIGRLRPTGQAYSRDFSGPNWLDQRSAAAAYEERDPTVLVVGGGQAGLSIGARLNQRGIDTLIVDRWPRVGDNWRQRYPRAHPAQPGARESPAVHAVPAELTSPKTSSPTGSRPTRKRWSSTTGRQPSSRAGPTTKPRGAGRSR